MSPNKLKPNEDNIPIVHSFKEPAFLPNSKTMCNKKRYNSEKAEKYLVQKNIQLVWQLYFSTNYYKSKYFELKKFLCFTYILFRLTAYKASGTEIQSRLYYIRNKSAAKPAENKVDKRLTTLLFTHLKPEL